MSKASHQTQSPRERVDFLRVEIRRHDQLYYEQAEPEISDREYDALVEELRTLEELYSDLRADDSPTQRIPSDRTPGFATIEHPLPMLSIDNTYSPEEAREFDARIHRFLNLSPSEPV